MSQTSHPAIILKSVTRRAASSVQQPSIPPHGVGIISHGAVDEERVREALVQQRSAPLRPTSGIIRKGLVDAETQRRLNAGMSQEVIDYLDS